MTFCKPIEILTWRSKNNVYRGEETCKALIVGFYAIKQMAKCVREE